MDSPELKEGCNPNCRGCSHRGWSNEKSLSQKQGFVAKTLAEWSDVIQPILAVEEEKRWGYRTSVTLAAEWDRERWNFGTKSRDVLIPIHKCPVHHPLVNNVVGYFSLNLPSSVQFPLAFLVITKNLCVLIVKQKDIVSTNWFTDEMQATLRHFGVEGVWLHFNPSAGRRLFEKGNWEKLFGTRLSVDLYGLTYGPTTFQQQIQELYSLSLDKAEEFLKPDNLSAVIDLYCGTGTSLRRWRNKNIQTIGVETNGEALECAAINAKGAQLLRGSCRLRIPQLSQWALQQLFLKKTIFMYANPPRTGMEPEVLDWIVKVVKPSRIAYLSCSPGTLGKNLRFFTNNHYRVVRIQPYDFFPQTHHVECLALLEYEKV